MNTIKRKKAIIRSVLNGACQSIIKDLAFTYIQENWNTKVNGDFTKALVDAPELGDPIAQKLRSLCEQITIDKEIASVKLSIGGRKLGDASISEYTTISLWQQLCEYHGY